MVVDIDKDGKRKMSSEEDGEGNSLELTLGIDLELSVLDSYVLCVPGLGFSTCGACVCSISIIWEHLEMQILGPTPGLLEVQKTEF